jgi:hypothetical protein
MTKHIPLINLYDHINDVVYLGSLSSLIGLV